jgi:hypothetical protein
MASLAADALLTRLQNDADADLVSLETTTDRTMSIGQDVWRLRWRGQLTTAVAADADLHTTCGAVLDVLTILEQSIAADTLQPVNPPIDLSTVNVLVDRPPPGASPSECDLALRSMRDAVRGVPALIWYHDRGRWIIDDEPAPMWSAEDPLVLSTVNDLLLPRLLSQPGLLATALVDAVGDPSLHLYPAPINSNVRDTFALRLDGLEIGTVTATTATLKIGKPSKTGLDSAQRQAFIAVFGHPQVTVGANAGPGRLDVSRAAERIRALLRRFRDADVPGAPITHRLKAGVRYIDEHALEARLLKGLIPLDDGCQLVLDDDTVARGSQFPTLWGHDPHYRYLDALVRRGRTPIAVELKVAVGGQGRYYRRSLVQAILYSHFIRNSPALEPWFIAADLDRAATEAAVGIPIPARWTATFDRDLSLLRRVAARFDATVHVLDDRNTPDYHRGEDRLEPTPEECEQLSWRLGAALASRWPRSLGRAVEAHGGGGLYDELRLHHVVDRALSWPAPPRLSLNRPGSLWVFSQTGTDRWVWRNIWNHLGAGGDLGEAADVVGAIAGLGKHEPVAGPTFPEMAVAFLEAVDQPGWSWRCAWTASGDVAPWVERYQQVLIRYNRTAIDDQLPTIARIWGAVRNGEAAAIVDQDTKRVWTWLEGDVREVVDGGSLERITTVATLSSRSPQV